MSTPATTYYQSAQADDDTKVSTDFIYKFLGHETNNPTTETGAKVIPITDRSKTGIAYDVQKRVLTLTDRSIEARHLAFGLDMSMAGFNAAKVNGKHVNDDAVDGDVLWTAAKILERIREQLLMFLQDQDIGLATIDQSGLMSAQDKALLLALYGEEGSEYAREFVYTSPLPLVEHVVTHGLGSFDLDYSVLVEHWDGSWRNDMVGVSFLDDNTVSISLSEASMVKFTARRRGDIWPPETLPE